MSKRITLYGVWGFYAGAVASILVLSALSLNYTQAMLMVFAMAIAATIVGILIAKYINRRGRPDTKLEWWQVLREIMYSGVGLQPGLIPLLFFIILLNGLSWVLHIHVLGF
jgi:hypothetical protein